MTDPAPGGQRVRLHVLPMDVEIEADRGALLLEAIEGAGLHVETLCGGRGICRRCAVVAPGLTDPPKRLEREAFSAEEIAAGHRLACLWHVEDDLEVEIAPLEDFAHKAFAGLDRWPPIEAASTVRRTTVRLAPPSLDDQRSDSRRLREALGGELRLEHEVARDLSRVLRTQSWRVSATMDRDRLLSIERAHLRPPLGVAVDLGTTSVAALVVNLRTGTAATVGAHSNSQARYGGEVMSRIEHAATPGGLEALQSAVVGDVNRIVAEACASTAVHPEDLVAVTVVGNTTMCHLFLGLDPAGLGAAPFVGVVDEGFAVEAGRLGLDVHPRAEVYVLPSVAGYVGADTVGAMLATRVDRSHETALLMDIGTNGELALAHQGALVTASAPAGPAFEGGQIHQGMRAATGAIDHVAIDPAGELTFTTIGDAPARGLCGSGLVDLCAELVRIGLVDPGGRFRREDELTGLDQAAARSVARRVRAGRAGRELVVAEAGATASGEAVVLTQVDVRQYQLVKAAIGAGAATLLDDAGLTPDDLEAVYLAGSFGSHIGLEAARRTGLVPEVPLDRIHDVGNAALEGARMVLLDPLHRADAQALALRTRHIELSGRPDFNERFLAALSLAPAATATADGLGSDRSGRSGPSSRQLDPAGA